DAGGITRVLGESATRAAVRASLHAYCGAGSAVAHLPVHEVEPVLPFVQAHLEVGGAWPAKEAGSPLDVEDAVGFATAHRGVDAAIEVGWALRRRRTQVVPHGQHGVA